MCCSGSLAFRVPVDTRRYADYLSKVKAPIDLSTIRNKIANFEYTSLRSFLADLELMIENSVAYNGPKHLVTQDARRLLNVAQKLADTPVKQEQFLHLERELQ